MNRKDSPAGQSGRPAGRLCGRAVLGGRRQSTVAVTVANARQPAKSHYFLSFIVAVSWAPVLRLAPLPLALFLALQRLSTGWLAGWLASWGAGAAGVGARVNITWRSLPGAPINQLFPSSAGGAAEEAPGPRAAAPYLCSRLAAASGMGWSGGGGQVARPPAASGLARALEAFRAPQREGRAKARNDPRKFDSVGRAHQDGRPSGERQRERERVR